MLHWTSGVADSSSTLTEAGASKALEVKKPLPAWQQELRANPNKLNNRFHQPFAIRQIIAETRGRKGGIVLSVLKTNGGARLLYQRLGFIIIDETAYHYRMRLDNP
jgi:hypothetical protein